MQLIKGMWMLWQGKNNLEVMLQTHVLERGTVQQFKS